MNDELDKLSDLELSIHFAREVALWSLNFENGYWIRPDGSEVLREDGDEGPAFPIFATSADAVLPWLEKEWWDANHRWTPLFRAFNVWIKESESKVSGYGSSPSFARAACIALIRAKRAESK